ncbi:gamma-glutamyltranspeptidase / glutathione hydrolase / leukotriene-C4 hydrolase [Sarotherodon galilaeus]
MAEGGRKSLVWDIRRSLLTLSAGELYKVAKKVGPADPGQPELDVTDQEGCFDHISSFMYSKPLLEAEDGGMVDLLMLKDFIDDVIENRQVCDDSEDVDSPVTQTFTQTMQPARPSSGMGDSPTQPVPVTTIANMVNRPPVAGTTSPAGLASSIPDITNAELQEMLNSYEALGKRLRQSVMVPTEQSPRQPTGLLVQANLTQSDLLQPHPPGQPRAQPTREGMISLRDLSYLQRREFRVQGGQVGDHSSDISYNNICKQMDEGIREGFPDAEIVRGVLRIIKPGTFKDMLINKDDLTVLELKGFLQAHLREKNSTELFQELMCARQDESETPQQFLYRVIGLKQRVLFTSKMPDAGIKYSAATVQDVFLHSVYQGLGYKHSDIRRELRPLLSSGEVSDETILRHIMRITSEESERQKRIGSSRRQNTTSAHSAQSELNTLQECRKQDRPIDTTKTDPIRELTAKVNELAGLVEAMRQQTLARPSDLVNPYSQNRSRNRKDKTFGCPNCVEQNRPDCCHCFICGEEGHRAVGCLKKSKNQGNVNRSLQRGAQ